MAHNASVVSDERSPHPRRIDWQNYAQAGPVRITDTTTGETRVEPALHPLQVKEIVAEGRIKAIVANKRRRQIARRKAAQTNARRRVKRPDPVSTPGPKALNKEASPGPRA